MLPKVYRSTFNSSISHWADSVTRGPPCRCTDIRAFRVDIEHRGISLCKKRLRRRRILFVLPRSSRLCSHGLLSHSGASSLTAEAAVICDPFDLGFSTFAMPILSCYCGTRRPAKNLRWSSYLPNSSTAAVAQFLQLCKSSSQTLG